MTTHAYWLSAQVLRRVCVLVAAVLPLQARADKSWPAFPNDSEIDIAIDEMTRRCSLDPNVKPTLKPNAVVKKFVGKRRRGSEEDSDVIVGTLRDAIDLSSVFIGAVVYWPRTDAISKQDAEAGRIYQAVVCHSTVDFQNGRFGPTFFEGDFVRMKTLREIEQDYANYERDARTGTAGNTFVHYASGWFKGPPEAPVTIEACPSIKGADGRAAGLVPAIGSARLRLTLTGAPNAMLQLTSRRDAQRDVVYLNLSRDTVTLDAKGRAVVDAEVQRASTGTLMGAIPDVVDVVGVGSGQKLGSVATLLGLGLQARVELRHLTTDASGNPDMALAATVRSRFHPDLDVAGYFDAWERACPMDRMILPSFGLDTALAELGWIIPDDAQPPAMNGFGLMLFGKDAAGRTYLRPLPGRPNYKSPTGTELPSIDLQANATHVMFPSVNLTLERRDGLDVAGTLPVARTTHGESAEPALLPPQSYLVVPVEQMPGWNEYTVCLLEARENWQAFLLSLTELYPPWSRGMAIINALHKSSCEFSRGETRNAFLTLMQSGSSELAEYIAFEGILVEQMSKWNGKLNLAQRLSPNDIKDQAQRANAAYRAALAVFNAAKP